MWLSLPSEVVFFFFFPYWQEVIWNSHKSLSAVAQEASSGSGLVSIKACSAFCPHSSESKALPEEHNWKLEVQLLRLCPCYAPWRVSPGHVGVGVIYLMNKAPGAGKFTFTSLHFDKCGTNCCCQQWHVPPDWLCPRPSAGGRRQVRAVFEP